MTTPTKHGGRRPGAGRPPAPVTLKRVLVLLSEAQIEKVRKLGYGNLSLGLRSIIDAFKR